MEIDTKSLEKNQHSIPFVAPEQKATVSAMVETSPDSIGSIEINTKKSQNKIHQNSEK